MFLLNTPLFMLHYIICFIYKRFQVSLILKSLKNLTVAASLYNDDTKKINSIYVTCFSIHKAVKNAFVPTEDKDN